MKSCIFVLIALGIIIAIIDAENDERREIDDKAVMLLQEKKCLAAEGYSEDIFPSDDVSETFDIILYLASEEVPQEAKCFVRCWLKRSRILQDNFLIDKNKETDAYCEREAKALANGDECEFAFAYQKCSRSLS
ncbi:hypothetical protein GQX74_002200 [Glossina fuscipes]|uniref:Uncharacterized protein n=1 Tax=Glossina palpalis gambiensis TaxID=67801 RepID=A0A1B0C6S9_9MUSC|nr:hypothetical protein GQX74_002200 [Glossina fuscipes]